MTAPLSLEDFAPKSTTACAVCRLPDDLRKQVEDARIVDKQRFTYPVISQWLNALGHSVSEDSLRRHINRHRVTHPVGGRGE